MEARILFRLELPSHKSIGVKAKQGKTVAEVILIVLVLMLVMVMVMFVILMTSMVVGNVGDYGDDKGNNHYFNSYFLGVGSNPAPIRVDSTGGGDLP